ncbi:hypothetical protein [Methylobacterium sp. Leaf118]|uniref:hypothetical protein n=1 Tax=Methylobacterium sp. Leaf118 TaxID=2876562 RepID=UPI001E611EF6|nr:hypothetical protein [Methylobacterium sp. Leaf118]
MKTALLALIAVLSPLCASAAPSVEKPGPYTLKRDQYACQNLADMQQLYESTGHNQVAVDGFLRRQDNAEAESVGMACTKLPKGATVIVRKRWIAFECVEVKGRPSSACFYTEKVSNVRYDDKSSWIYGDY